jgi:hypothetical protein
MFISSSLSYYIFEYYSSKRQKQPDRGNNNSVLHTFILLVLKVSLFFHVTPCRVGLSGFAIKIILGFPFLSKRTMCNVHFTLLHLFIRLIFGEDYNDPSR